MRRGLVFPAVLLLAGCTAASDVDPAPSATGVAGPVTPAGTAAAPTTIEPDGWAATVAEVSSGVVQLTVEGCGGTFTGSGALVAPDLVLTAAHLVSDAIGVSVSSGDAWVSGHVVAIDPTTELALVRLFELHPGHVFSLTDGYPDVGAAILVLGYPSSDDLSVTDGIVSAVDVSKDLDGTTIDDQLLISAAINYGNSGGPVITADGGLAGIVSSMDRDDETGERREGRAYAVSASEVARPLIEALEPDSDVPFPGCSDPGQVLIHVEPTDELADVLTNVLADHAYGINTADYAAAFSLFTPALQERVGPLDRWSDGVASSIWSTINAQTLGGTADAPSLDVELMTREAEAGTSACTLRTMTYTFVSAPEGATPAPGGTPWRIDSATQHAVSACP